MRERLGISGFCIKHKVAPILIFIFLVIFGLTQFSNIPLSLMPDMEFPYSVVMGVYPGASPEDVADLVAKPIEEAMASVANVKEITSNSSENMCYVILQFEDGTDMNIANMKMREKLDMVALPEDCQEPTIMNINMDLMPVAVIALTGDELANLQNLADDLIIPSMERLDGVASVNTYGGVTRQAVVEVNPERVAGYGLSISYISNFLAGANIIYPGGTVDNGSQTLNVHTDGKFRSLEDVADTRIALPTGGTVRLDEVASIYWDDLDSDSIAKSNGDPCVILMVNKQSGTNTVEAARAVRTAMEELQQENSKIQYQIVMDQSDYINQSIHTVIENIVLGVIIAAIVVFLFLRRGGATATIVISMPVCILTVFVLMRLCNITMNLMSLGGIGIGVGMIVDNSVVVLENIFRYQSEGKDRWASCVQGAREVSMSVIASTLTTVVVFLPVALTQGLVAQMFRDLCLTIVFLIAASLLISLTLVPLLCYFLLDEVKVQKWAMQKAAKEAKKQNKKGILDRLGSGYQKLLRHFVDHRWRGVIITVVLILIFMSVASRAKFILTPDTDQGSFSVNISMPIGSEKEKTAEIADRVLAIVEQEVPEAESYYYTAQATSGSVTVALIPMEERLRSAQEIADDLRPSLRDIAGCEITVDSSGMTSTGFTSSDAEVTITGDDYAVLTDIANDLVTKIAAIPDAMDVDTSASEQVPQVNIYVDNENAARFGLTTATIGAAVRAELTGATATKMTISGSEIDVMVKGSETSSQSLDALKAMPLSTPTGATIPLSLVADVTIELAPQTITRENQTMSVTVTASSRSGNAQFLSAAVQTVLDSYTLPDGYFAENGGAMDDITESFGSLIAALGVSIVLLYFVLAVQFESFLMPIAIMLIMPIAFSGALFGLPVTGQDISVVALLGLVILAGTVVNSSIILISYINIRRESFEEDKRTAILNACPRRVRPVLITTLTTILGLMPMALGIGGEGSEMMKPMAIVMIFGMIFSTILTLLFTPVYYSLIDSLGNQFRKLGRKKRREARAGQEPIFPDIN